VTREKGQDGQQNPLKNLRLFISTASSNAVLAGHWSMASPYAFVTLLTSDSYLPGALTLAAALKDIHPSPAVHPEVDFQTVCLVTPETVDIASIKLLRKAFDVVVGVEIIEENNERGLQLLGEYSFMWVTFLVSLPSVRTILGYTVLRTCGVFLIRTIFLSIATTCLLPLRAHIVTTSHSLHPSPFFLLSFQVRAF
jgi:hypothetical protein